MTAPKRLPSNRDPVVLARTAAIVRTALARLEQQQSEAELKEAS